MRNLVILMSIQKRRDDMRHHVREKQKGQYFQRIRKEMKKHEELERRSGDRNSLVQFERDIIEAAQKNIISFREVEEKINNCWTSLQPFFFSSLIQIFLLRQSKSIEDLQYLSNIISDLNPHLQLSLSHKSLYDNLQILIQQTSNSEQYILLSLNLTWKVYYLAPNKEQFSWLAQTYIKLIQNLGFSKVILKFIYAVIKTDGPLPDIEVIRWLIHAEIDNENHDKEIKIMEIICYYLYRSNKDVNECISLISLSHLTLSRIFMTFKNSCNIQSKAQVLQLLIAILTTLEDQAVITLLDKYPIQIYDTIVESFDMELNNEQIFNILSSLAIIFELVPPSISYMNSFGVFNKIEQFAESRYVRIRQMSQLILQMNSLENI